MREGARQQEIVSITALASGEKAPAGNRNQQRKTDSNARDAKPCNVNDGRWAQMKAVAFANATETSDCTTVGRSIDASTRDTSWRATHPIALADDVPISPPPPLACLAWPAWPADGHRR